MSNENFALAFLNRLERLIQERTEELHQVQNKRSQLEKRIADLQMSLDQLEKTRATERQLSGQPIHDDGPSDAVRVVLRILSKKGCSMPYGEIWKSFVSGGFKSYVSGKDPRNSLNARLHNTLKSHPELIARTNDGNWTLPQLNESAGISTEDTENENAASSDRGGVSVVGGSRLPG